jgi:hypothetical protein
MDALAGGLEVVSESLRLGRLAAALGALDRDESATRGLGCHDMSIPDPGCRAGQGRTGPAVAPRRSDLGGVPPVTVGPNRGGLVTEVVAREVVILGLQDLECMTRALPLVTARWRLGQRALGGSPGRKDGLE